MNIVEPDQFQERLIAVLRPRVGQYGYVTGPGRSGAIASVYASHFLGIPYVPYKRKATGRPLIVDTASLTGKTIRKASQVYGGADFVPMFQQPPRIKFWYERLSMCRGRGNEFRVAS